MVYTTVLRKSLCGNQRHRYLPRLETCLLTCDVWSSGLLINSLQDSFSIFHLLVYTQCISCSLCVYIYVLFVSACWFFLLCAALLVYYFIPILGFTRLCTLYVDFFIICISFITSGTIFERMHLCLLCGIKVQGLIVSFLLSVYPHI